MWFLHVDTTPSCSHIVTLSPVITLQPTCKTSQTFVSFRGQALTGSDACPHRDRQADYETRLDLIWWIFRGQTDTPLWPLAPGTLCSGSTGGNTHKKRCYATEVTSECRHVVVMEYFTVPPLLFTLPTWKHSNHFKCKEDASTHCILYIFDRLVK